VVAHGRGHVEEDAQVQVVLGLEQPHEQLARTRIHRVVDAAVVVARVVLPLVGEVERVAEPFAAVFAGEAPSEPTARA
jgi:hypothetical protein